MRQLFEHHPVIGYRFIPGLKARVEHEGGGYLVRVNQAGFRCAHELVNEKPPGIRRVLLFGDSYTAGDGVSNGERYGDLLETLVPRLQVYNFALPGTGTDQHYLVWRELAQTIEHDLVIIAVLVENIRRVAARYRPYLGDDGGERFFAKPYFVLEGGALALRGVPVPKEPLAEVPEEEVDRGGRFAWARRAVNALGPTVKDQLQRLSHYQPLPAYDDRENPDWQLMRAILVEWTGRLRAPAMVVPLPLYQHVEETASAAGYQARFAELPGVTLHDPLPGLLRFSPAERRAMRFAKDCHPTPAMHRALAQSLAPVIAERLP